MVNHGESSLHDKVMVHHRSVAVARGLQGSVSSRQGPSESTQRLRPCWTRHIVPWCYMLLLSITIYESRITSLFSNLFSSSSSSSATFTIKPPLNHHHHHHRCHRYDHSIVITLADRSYALTNWWPASWDPRDPTARQLEPWTPIERSFSTINGLQKQRENCYRILVKSSKIEGDVDIWWYIWIIVDPWSCHVADSLCINEKAGIYFHPFFGKSTICEANPGRANTRLLRPWKHRFLWFLSNAINRTSMISALSTSHIWSILMYLVGVSAHFFGVELWPYGFTTWPDSTTHGPPSGAMDRLPLQLLPPPWVCPLEGARCS